MTCFAQHALLSKGFEPHRLRLAPDLAGPLQALIDAMQGFLASRAA